MDNARQFAQTHLMPRVKADFREEKFDRAVVRLLGDNGYLGCTLN